jgi:hypothetical protein
MSQGQLAQECGPNKTVAGDAGPLRELLKTVSVVTGPPRAERSIVKHVARIGQDVKIKCAIEAFPAPLFSWSKEGETIDYTWDR